MNIHVVNRNAGVKGISVMRGKSALANPYCIRVDGDRAQVIAKYRAWLWLEMKNPSSNVSMELKRLLNIARKGSLVLVCCCKPLDCHGDVIRNCLVWLNGLK